MVKIENDCCDCAAGGYPCRGSACPLRRARHLYCDRCHDEVDVLYDFAGYQLCGDCVLESLEKVEADDENF